VAQPVIAFLTTAELSIVATVVVAVAGFYFNSVSAKRDREARIAQAKLDHDHAERLAFSERTFRARAEAYADAARLLRIQRLVGRITGQPGSEMRCLT
jgi:hypothetical protein